MSYFDLLPDDIILLLFKLDLNFNGITPRCRVLYDKLLIEIDKGLVNPNDWFKTFIGCSLCDEITLDCTSEITLNSTYIYIDIHHLIDHINQYAIGCYYYAYTSKEYSKLVTAVYLVDKRICEDLKSELNEDMYVFVTKVRDSCCGHYDIHIRNNWKNFWNLDLNTRARGDLLISNGFI